MARILLSASSNDNHDPRSLCSVSVGPCSKCAKRNRTAEKSPRARRAGPSTEQPGAGDVGAVRVAGLDTPGDRAAGV
ncbi:hypothetical protein DSI43_04810, partial [Mycobacterium tuberculosis]